MVDFLFSNSQKMPEKRDGSEGLSEQSEKLVVMQMDEDCSSSRGRLRSFDEPIAKVSEFSLNPVHLKEESYQLLSESIEKRKAILTPRAESRRQSMLQQQVSYDELQQKVAGLEQRIYKLQFEKSALQSNVESLQVQLVSSRDKEQDLAG